MNNKRLIALSIWNTYKFNINRKNDLHKFQYKDMIVNRDLIICNRDIILYSKDIIKTPLLVKKR